MNLKEQHSSGWAKVSFIPLQIIVYLKNARTFIFRPWIWHIGALQYILRSFVNSKKEKKFVKVAKLFLSDISEIFAVIYLINKLCL